MTPTAALAKTASSEDCWRGFKPGSWRSTVDVRDFIVSNVTPYSGDEKFLAGPTARTKAVWAKLQPYFKEEQKKGVLAVDAKTPSTLLAHKPGYIDEQNEVIVGLQTDQPFKRAIFPFGGLRMVEAGLKAAGFEADPQVHEAFTKYRKTHNDGVFDAYTPEIMRCRRSGIITGLPDSYGRGRIIGDYRRVALYGVYAPDRSQESRNARRSTTCGRPTRSSASVRNWPSRSAHCKISPRWRSRTAATSRGRHRTRSEAVQWTYLAYLGAIKEANGAAMSIGRISTFLDIYIERDLKEGKLDEAGAQELWDQLVQKLRIVRFLRTPDYDALFSGDPYWATECVGGHGSERAAAGDEEQLSDAAYADQPRARAGAEHHGALVEGPAGNFQAILRQGQQGDVGVAVRERRPDAPALGRRLRHRLLRVGDEAWQADAVLRRARESRQGAALRHQWRPGRGFRRPGRAAVAADDRRCSRLRRGVREVRPRPWSGSRGPTCTR